MCGAFGTTKPVFQTSENRIGQILPAFFVAWTHFTGFWSQGVHIWGQKTKNMCNSLLCFFMLALLWRVLFDHLKSIFLKYN